MQLSSFPVKCKVAMQTLYFQYVSFHSFEEQQGKMSSSKPGSFSEPVVTFIFCSGSMSPGSGYAFFLLILILISGFT